MSIQRFPKLIGLAVLVLAMMACGLTAPGSSSAPTPDFSSPLPVSPTDTVAAPTLAVIVTPVSLPDVPTPTSDSGLGVLEYDRDSQAYRVQFAPGGTWIEIHDTTTSGALFPDRSKRYMLSAMQGQVMSVSIAQSYPIIIEVASKDGLLSLAKEGSSFWRGALPVTGYYFITVTPHTPGEFDLRITINPPGQAVQHFDYISSNPAFNLRYTDEFAPTSYIPSGEYRGTPALVLAFLSSEFYSPITNLGEAYFIVNTIADKATCTQVSAPNETPLGQKNFNGYDFTVSEAVGAGAGNIYDQLFYRANLKGTCYEIVFFMHSSNIGNYTPGTVVEFNRDALVKVFESTLANFVAK